MPEEQADVGTGESQESTPTPEQSRIIELSREAKKYRLRSKQFKTELASLRDEVQASKSSKDIKTAEDKAEYETARTEYERQLGDEKKKNSQYIAKIRDIRTTEALRLELSKAGVTGVERQSVLLPHILSKVEVDFDEETLTVSGDFASAVGDVVTQMGFAKPSDEDTPPPKQKQTVIIGTLPGQSQPVNMNNETQSHDSLFRGAIRKVFAANR